MTVVNFDFADPAGVPVKGYVSLVPTRRVTVGDEVRLPTALRVRLEAGEASVELMPSTTQWVWRVAELVPGGITRYIAVPDSEMAVEYADLESVDPSSLDVSSASVPAWEIATRTAQDMLDKVGEIDGKVERAEGAAAGAESSASEAESHENAAKSSADAAASSARDAASNATAAASSARSAASSASAAESSASGAASSAGEAGRSAEDAAGSATAAALSASDAAAHAESAGLSTDAAAMSATAAADSVSTAASHATSATQSASEAAKSATAAAGSVSAAASHADAAAQSASEASASASATKTSETNAAASATAAQNAVNGFGLEVGTTTTGEPGTDASVEIQKQGTKYTANFTIPRGDSGERAAVIHDYTLTGDGASSNPLRMIDGNFINSISLSGDEADANRLQGNRIYRINSSWKNIPQGNFKTVSGILLDASYGNPHLQCVFAYTDGLGASIFVRQSWLGSTWSDWTRIIRENNISSYVPLSTYNTLVARVAALEAKLNDFAAIQTRLQALETRVESLENNQ